MGERGSQNKTSELYETLPFMEAFPFEEYEIDLESDGDQLEVSPILIKTLGTFGESQHVNFNYVEHDATILVSFHREDILYAVEISSEIKKFDAVRKEIEAGLTSNNILIKVDAIKKGRKFIRLLKNDNLMNPEFAPFLQEMLTLHAVSLESHLILELQKLKPQRILDFKFTPGERMAIFSYLNFQLHYARILLGVVIAAKIY
jgi:hypothetical protein